MPFVRANKGFDRGMFCCQPIPEEDRICGAGWRTFMQVTIDDGLRQASYTWTTPRITFAVSLIPTACSHDQPLP